MSLAQRVGEIAQQRNNEKAVLDFAHIAKFIMANRGTAEAAAIAASDCKAGLLGMRLAAIVERAMGRQISREVLQLQKAAVPASGLSALADYSAISSGFINSLVNDSAFDSMLPSMVPVPLGTGTVGAITAGATAYSVAEGSMKPITRLSIANQTMTPVKSASAVVSTQELVRSAFVGATQFIANELRRAVAITTGSTFLSVISAGAPVVGAVGNTPDAVRIMLSTLLSTISLGQGSSPFLITTSAIAKAWSVLSANGQSAFPNMTPQGGNVQGVQVVVSDAVVSGQVVLADASGIAAAAGEMALLDIGEGSIVADTLPTSPPSGSDVMMSLWQMNLAGILVERYFCAAKLRSDAVAVASNVSNSPS